MAEADSTFRALDTLTVARRFNGPPRSGNGGYVAGLLARQTPDASATVTLRLPPPLEREMRVRDDDGATRLYDGTALIAEAVRADTATANAFAPIDPVPYDTAAEASAAFLAARHRHPYPTCFVCGTSRVEGDGMRLFPGRLPGRPDTTACAWVPDPSLAGPDGVRVRPEFVWAALDCPGAWTALDSATPALLLGRITARVDALPYLGERCVVMGHLLAREGRKVHTATTLYDGDGRVAGHAEAVWIEPRRS
ncbi:hypothetical protein LO772_15085 [Yinghuangia sp. ASG 101]|uniref:hypothetical protein n=1 Tax=Yinghuangia sp. ASG 101 TaxID=2896848 RepID=UPI001E2AE519|nr:hypothetical protein [Yinghuangia sp. ASG 101]UGQ14776.1 hypothetical protein LO772_15085 [Yinghuangia sp. ASG 101]